MFDRDQARNLLAEFDRFSRNLCTQRGDAVAERVRASYSQDGSELRLTIVLRAKGANGVVKDKDADGLSAYGKLYGLDDKPGQTFQFTGKTFRIVGLSLRRGKYPISAESVPDGKKFKFRLDDVQRVLGTKSVAGLGVISPADLDADVRAEMRSEARYS